MTTVRRIALAAGTAAALLTLVTGCGDGHAPGPAGRVVAKDVRTYTIHHARSGKTPGWTQFVHEYYLTTKDPSDGSTTEFEVSSGDYDDCVRGANYPRCTE